MSRIGKKPIAVPQGVKIALEGTTVRAEGPKGKLSQSIPSELSVSMDSNVLTVARSSDHRNVRALHGLTRSLLANMVHGVKDGFERKLEIVGIGYRCQLQGKALQLALGYSHPIEYRAPQGIKLTAPVPTQIVVEGANKEVVGQVAAEIRSLRPPEPYKGKGVKYVGEQIRRKAGKAGGK